MLVLFKKKSKKEQLQLKYEKLIREWHKLSKTDRKMSDMKYAEAEEVMKLIESMD